MLKDELIATQFIEKYTMYTKSMGCFDARVFRSQAKLTEYSFLTFWTDQGAYSNYLNSDEYQKVSTLIGSDFKQSSEILKLRFKHIYSPKHSTCYSINRIYVEDYHKNIAAFEKAYNREKSLDAGVFGVEVYTPSSSNRVISVLINWKDETSRSHYNNYIEPFENGTDEEFGIIGNDTYDLMELILDI